MADERLLIEAVLDAAGVTRGAAQASGAIRTMSAEAQAAGKAMAAAMLPMAGAATAGLAFAGALRTGVTEMEEMQRAEFHLRQTLRNVGSYSEDAMKKVRGLADSFEHMSLFEDDEIIHGFSLLVGVTGNYDRALQNLGLAIDFASARGKSLADAMTSIGQIMQGNFRELRQIDPAFARMAHEGANVNEVLDLMRQRFSGMGVAAHEGIAGARHELRLAFNDLGEALGGDSGEGWENFFRGAADALHSFAGVFRGEFRDIFNDMTLGFLDTLDTWEAAIAKAFGRGSGPSTNANTYDWSGGFFRSGIYPAPSGFVGPPGLLEPGVRPWQGPPTFEQWSNMDWMNPPWRLGEGIGASTVRKGNRANAWDMFGGGYKDTSGKVYEDPYIENFKSEFEAATREVASMLDGALWEGIKGGADKGVKYLAEAIMRKVVYGAISQLAASIVGAMGGSILPFGVGKYGGGNYTPDMIS